MRTAAIYARVSSEGDRQSTDRQVSDLNSGRQNAIKNGVQMGRKLGSTKSREHNEKEYAKVLRLLSFGESIRNTAKLCEVSPSTVQSLKKEFLTNK